MDHAKLTYEDAFWLFGNRAFHAPKSVTQTFKWAFRVLFPVAVLVAVFSSDGLSGADRIVLAIAPLIWLYVERLSATGRGFTFGEDGLVLTPSGRLLPSSDIAAVDIQTDDASGQGTVTVTFATAQRFLEFGGNHCFGKTLVLAFVAEAEALTDADQSESHSHQDLAA